MMDIANVRAHYIPNPAHYHRHSHNDSKNGYEKIAHNQSFYDSSMMVLFDLPNAIVVSTVSPSRRVLSSYLYACNQSLLWYAKTYHSTYPFPLLIVIVRPIDIGMGRMFPSISTTHRINNQMEKEMVEGICCVQYLSIHHTDYFVCVGILAGH